MTEPCIVLDAHCSDLDLGRAVEQAVEMSGWDVSPPTEWKGVLAPLLAAAGVKSWSTFAKRARCVEIERDGAALRFIPTKNQGPTDGFEHLSGRSVEIARPSPETIGAHLREALRACE